MEIKCAAIQIVTTQAAARLACAVEPPLISDINFFQAELLTTWSGKERYCVRDLEYVADRKSHGLNAPSGVSHSSFLRKV
jgi:hypothetical protein